MEDTLRFYSGFQGESSYVWRSQRVAIRWGLFDNNTLPSAYQATARQLVGCVYSATESTEYPPAAVVAHFPGYVPARVRPGSADVIEYQAQPPQQVRHHRGLFAAAHVKEMGGLL